ncbi:hypothetical protein L1987_25525 [Smallanthus sonchifolius]|uniref:Uncharacterized protein n=1 Tax=Smallanthus sonchifolius TaxID=185202 RepID=A0ACB9IPF1_9ASTR|nr:hypothetical protein L1987_25525 [Smallanthus sonchifolius]
MGRAPCCDKENVERSKKILYANIGSRWSIIAGQLPGRTDNDVKNNWNTKLKKKLLARLQSFQEKAFFLSIFTLPITNTIQVRPEDHESIGGEGYEVSTNASSSSEGGSCLSQISYGNCSKNHHKKQEDRFSLQGFGDQSQSFIINHSCTEQEPKGCNLNINKSSLHSELEEVKHLILGNTNSSYMLNTDDEYKTTHDH